MTNDASSVRARKKKPGPSTIGSPASAPPIAGPSRPTAAVTPITKIAVATVRTSSSAISAEIIEDRLLPPRFVPPDRRVQLSGDSAAQAQITPTQLSNATKTHLYSVT